MRVAGCRAARLLFALLLALPVAPPSTADEPPAAPAAPAPPPEQLVLDRGRDVARLEAAEPVDGPALADALVEWGRALRSVARPRDAAVAFGRAAEVSENARGAAHALTCLARLERADARRLMLQHAQSHAELDDVIRLARSGAVTPDDAGASLCTKLGFLLHETGRSEEVVPWFERALALRLRLHPPGDDRVAGALGDLAVAHMELGEVDTALVLAERAVNAHRPRPPDLALALALTNLAVQRSLGGDAAAALAPFDEALALRERALGAGASEVAFTLAHKAQALMHLGRLDEARDALDRALAIVEPLRRNDNWQDVIPVLYRAMLARREGDLAWARVYFERAVSDFDRLLPPERRDAGRALAGLAEVLALEGERERARALFAQAVARTLLHMRRALAPLRGGQRISRVQRLRPIIDLYLVTAPLLGENGYDTALRVKGIVARAEVVEQRLAREASPENQPHVDRLRGADRELASILAAAPPRKSAGRAAWEAHASEAAARREDASRALADRIASYRGAVERETLGLPRVQAALAADEALLDVLRVSGRYVAWIVRPTGEPERIDLGDAAAVEAECLLLRQAVRQEDVRTITATSERLGSRLVAPLVRDLTRGLRRLVVAPDAGLATIPFGLLSLDGELLSDRLELTLVLSAQDLVPGEAAADRSGALVLGGVDFGGAGRFTSLPHTESEAVRVHELLGGTATLLQGARASEAAFRELAPTCSRLHLATHGFEDRPASSGALESIPDVRAGLLDARLQGGDPRLRCGLALAGANRPSGDASGDGILTALEVTHLDLRGCRDVVLSACSTAMGEWSSGEGVLGLAQAFQVAGARSVLAALWDVGDAATQRFMQGYYESLAVAGSGGARTALRDAQHRLRREPPAGRSETPARHWAAFVVYERR
jgi:CHAT domain-containing protein